MLRRVLKRPQGSDQSRQLLGHLSFVLSAFPLHDPVRLGFLVIRLITSILLQSQILGEQLRVAQALQNSVHETRIAVVFQTGHSGDFVPGQKPPAVALVRGDGSLAFLLEGCESPIVLVALGRVQLRAEMRERGQSLQESAHETPHGAHRAPAEELLAEAGLLLFN